LEAFKAAKTIQLHLVQVNPGADRTLENSLQKVQLYPAISIAFTPFG
jgi:hypothetical protein